MTTYPRTDEGFAKAHDNALWLANFHNKPFYIIIPKDDEKNYTVTRFFIPDDLAQGTGFLTAVPSKIED